MANKRMNKITEAINSLNKTNTYNLLMFFLSQLRNDPKFGVLSEVCYLLDGKSLSNFLSYYGGMTIKVPSMRDFRLATQALLLYQYVNIEGENDFEKALLSVCGDEFSKDEVKDAYKRLLDVAANFDFGRE